MRDYSKVKHKNCPAGFLYSDYLHVQRIDGCQRAGFHMKSVARFKVNARPRTYNSVGAWPSGRVRAEFRARRAKPRHDLGEPQEFPEILSAEESADEEEPAGEDDEQHNNGGEEGISIRIGRGDTFAARGMQYLSAYHTEKSRRMGKSQAFCAMPRNARQVGHLLADGLAHGTDALGIESSIRLEAVSLPHDSGGALQRRLLESEGVTFSTSGTVSTSTFWSRSEPFFTSGLPAARRSTSSRGLL